MKNKKKTFTGGMNVGSSSILVTFVLLCLVTFAALSFVSANSDNLLAKETGERIQAYYLADNYAEINLANIDSLLSRYAESLEYSEDKKDEYLSGVEDLFNDNSAYVVSKQGSDIFISYVCKINDNQQLNVTLKAVYPKSENDDSFVITQWESVPIYNPENVPITFEEEKGGLLF